jgi:hypothetical protein
MDRYRGFLRWTRADQALIVFLSFTRRTNFNPDQISVTAHTFTSTSPASSPTPRTTSSVRSVATPELFLGQLTHSIPAGASSFAMQANSFVNSVRDFVNNMEKSRALGGFGVVHLASASRSSSRTSAGWFTKCTRKFALIPNFCGSGVPEYPGMNFYRRADRKVYAFEILITALSRQKV